jgi:hypothetical protein
VLCSAPTSTTFTISFSSLVLEHSFSYISSNHHEPVLESTATMSFNLRTPTLALTGLSMCLCLAIIGTAGRSLHVYHNQHSTNPWLLPVWPNHFDTRELQMLIGTSAGVVVCNAVLVLGLLVKKVKYTLRHCVSKLTTCTAAGKWHGPSLSASQYGSQHHQHRLHHGHQLACSTQGYSEDVDLPMDVRQA